MNCISTPVMSKQKRPAWLVAYRARENDDFCHYARFLCLQKFFSKNNTHVSQAGNRKGLVTRHCRNIRCCEIVLTVPIYVVPP